MSNQIPLSPKMKDITSLRFGSLVAKFPVGRSTKRNVLWEFQCDCGALYVSEACWVVAQSKKATNPKAPSCGCLNKETTKELRRTHGMSTHPLFWAWSAMVERCHNPSNPNYPKYGGKGGLCLPRVESRLWGIYQMGIKQWLGKGTAPR